MGDAFLLKTHQLKNALEQMISVTKDAKRVLTLRYGVLDPRLPDITEVLHIFNQLLETEDNHTRLLLFIKIDDFVHNYYRELNTLVKRFGLPAYPLPDFFESRETDEIESPFKRATASHHRSENVSYADQEKQTISIRSPHRAISPVRRKNIAVRSPQKSPFRTKVEIPPPAYRSPVHRSVYKLPLGYLKAGNSAPITIINRSKQQKDARLIGAIGDGSCFFHSICTAIDYIYRIVDRTGKGKIAQILRTAIADALESPSPDGRGDLFEAIGDGLFMLAQVANSELGDQNQYLQKLRQSCEYVGDEIYMPTSYVTGLNIVVLYEEDGYAVPHSGMRRSDVTPANPNWSADCNIEGISCEKATVVILYRNKHYELVAPSDGGYIWDARDPFVNSLF